MDEKSYENILINEISCRTLIGAKPLQISFDQIDGFIRVYDGTRYLVLFGLEKYDTIYYRIKYLISQKNSITYYANNKFDSYNSLPIEFQCYHTHYVSSK